MDGCEQQQVINRLGASRLSAASTMPGPMSITDRINMQEEAIKKMQGHIDNMDKRLNILENMVGGR